MRLASITSETVNNTYFEGTLIAAIITKTKIMLFSDGRITEHLTNRVITDDFSKVHKITDKIGILTAGAYLDGLDNELVNICCIKGLKTIEDFIGELKGIVETKAEVVYKQRQSSRKDTKIALFIIGFDKSNKPHFYWMDNQTESPFKINERALFQPEHDVEIAAMSHGSGILENPSAILAGFIQQNIHNNTLEAAIRLGFEQTKNYLSAKNPSIGGKTFSLVL